MKVRISKLSLKYTVIAIALFMVGLLSVSAIGSVYAQISQPITQVGGGVRIAQPVAQGGFVGSSVISAPLGYNNIPPGYSCYQSYPGGPIKCYPPNAAYVSGGNYYGNYYTPGGVYQPVQQTGFGTQIAAPYARI